MLHNPKQRQENLNTCNSKITPLANHHLINQMHLEFRCFDWFIVGNASWHLAFFVSKKSTTGKKFDQYMMYIDFNLLKLGEDDYIIAVIRGHIYYLLVSAYLSLQESNKNRYSIKLNKTT